MNGPAEIAGRCARGVLGERTNYRGMSSRREHRDGKDVTVITGAGVEVTITDGADGGEVAVFAGTRRVGRISWADNQLRLIQPTDGQQVSLQELPAYEIATQVGCQIAQALAHLGDPPATTQ